MTDLPHDHPSPRRRRPPCSHATRSTAPASGPPTSSSCAARAPYLWDADGRRYLDGMAGIAVASVGHGNERLADAIAAQARR
jgi:adenosylmethionine-8-amino-7-oxononanoate aminotransferase